MINELAKEALLRAKDWGRYDDDTNIVEKLALTHSEVSKAIKSYLDYKNASIDDPEFISDGRTIREDLDLANHDVDYEILFKQQIKGTLEDELANVVIRVMELAAFKEIDLEYHIKARMRYNLIRLEANRKMLKPCNRVTRQDNHRCTNCGAKEGHVCEINNI